MDTATAAVSAWSHEHACPFFLGYLWTYRRSKNSEIYLLRCFMYTTTFNGLLLVARSHDELMEQVRAMRD
jgi:hypothetical protein